MKKWFRLNRIGLAALVGLLVVGGLSVRAYSGDSPRTVIENQTVQGSYVVEGDTVAKDETLGVVFQSAATSRVTNFRVEGASQQCEAASSSLCFSSVNEVRALNFVSTTYVFENPRSVTTTARIKLVPYGNTLSSSTFLFTVYASNTPFIAYNMDLSGAFPNNAPRLLDRFPIVTGTLPMISSLDSPSLSLKTSSTIEVGGAQDVILFVQAISDTRICQNNGAGCEAPTSSNTGLNYHAIVDWDYVVSSTADF